MLARFCREKSVTILVGMARLFYNRHSPRLYSYDCVDSSILLRIVHSFSNGLSEHTYTFAFADIARINLGGHGEIHHSSGPYAASYTTTAYWLDLYTRDGRYIKWSLDDRLGELDVIGKGIIAAHLYYWQRL
jgi:hypothetical protein